MRKSRANALGPLNSDIMRREISLRDGQMNQRRGKLLAVLSLVATSGVPILILIMRVGIFRFQEDYYGLKALSFALICALALLLAGTVLGGLAWSADHRSWLARAALIVNGVLLAGLLWLLLTL